MKTEKIQYLNLIQKHIISFRKSCLWLKTLAIILFVTFIGNLALLKITTLSNGRLFFELAFMVLPVVALSFLDANYLKIERGFRYLYSYVRLDDKPADFSFNLKNHLHKIDGLESAYFSWSVIGFYAPLVLVMSAIIVLQLL